MKKAFNKTIWLALLIFVMLGGSRLFSQTAGNFVFSVTTTSTGGYSPKHLIAIWIENGSSSFVKTKIMYSSGSNLDHLATWTTRSGSSIVDAATGATLSTHGVVSFIWNGTDVSGNVVPDGTYNAWVEMAWASSLTTGKTVTSYSFTKGPNSFSSAPANTTNFLGVSLTWTPSTPTLIENEIQNSDIRVYPNPTSGQLNIDFKKVAQACIIQVISETGIQVFKQNIVDVPVGIRSFDLGSLAPGIYYITLHLPGKDISFRIIRMK